MLSFSIVIAYSLSIPNNGHGFLPAIHDYQGLNCNYYDFDNETEIDFAIDYDEEVDLGENTVIFTKLLGGNIEDDTVKLTLNDVVVIGEKEGNDFYFNHQHIIITCNEQ